MKHLILAVAAITFLASAEQAEAASSMFIIEHYPQASQQGWPKWIGRLEHIAYLRYERPQMGPQYLPLSLIRTGAFDALVNEVMTTPNVDMTEWPEWIGDR